MSSNLPALREKWTQLYHITLPHLAKSRDPAQPHWPVFLDHCFARIILDNAIGVTQPWTAVVKAPAVRNMSEGQVRAAIELGEAIVSGRADLVELDGRSLRLRGKRGKSSGEVRGDKAGVEDGAKNEMDSSPAVAERGEKRKSAVDDDVGGIDDSSSPQKRLKVAKKKEGTKDEDTTRTIGTISKYFLPLSTTKSRKVGVSSITSTNLDGKHRDRPISTPTMPTPETTRNQTQEAADATPAPDQSAIANSRPAGAPSAHQPSSFPNEVEAGAKKGLQLILDAKDMTPFRREVLSLLCMIPRGQWTTYAAMARHINLVRSHTSTTSPPKACPSKTSTVSSKTCARAIGNAMRSNPFAPLVPCHRVLAADGSIGGFGGHWGEEGKFAGEKRRLLREEGVRFDGAGKAVGRPWEGWAV